MVERSKGTSGLRQPGEAETNWGRAGKQREQWGADGNIVISDPDRAVLNVHHTILTAQEKQSRLGKELSGFLLDGHHNFLGKFRDTCEGCGVVGDVTQVIRRQAKSFPAIRRNSPVTVHPGRKKSQSMAETTIRRIMGSLAALRSSIWTYIFIGRAEGKLDGRMLQGSIQH